MKDTDGNGDTRNIENFLMWHFSKRKDAYLALRTTDLFGTEILNFLKEKLSSRGKLLDLGTGSGTRLEYLLRNKLNADVYGVDICRELLSGGRRKFRKDINLILADVRHLPFASSSFDSVVCRSLLHHLIGRSPTACRKNVMSSVNEATRVLKNGGVVFVTEICVKHRLQSWILFFLTYILARLNIAVRYFGIHARVIVSFLTPKELSKVLVHSNIKVLKWRSSEWMRIKRYKWTWLMSDTMHIGIIGTKHTLATQTGMGDMRGSGALTIEKYGDMKDTDGNGDTEKFKLLSRLRVLIGLAGRVVCESYIANFNGKIPLRENAPIFLRNN